jgi:hypothetical protein
VDPGGIQPWVGLKNRIGGGAIFFGDGVDGFTGTHGVGGGSLGGERSPPENDEKKESQAAHGNEISYGERAIY